jgi:hypothetical protein
MILNRRGRFSLSATATGGIRANRLGNNLNVEIKDYS